MTDNTTTSEKLRTYQARVKAWMTECFSMEVCRDSIERNHRFLEEALELVQSNGCTVSEAHQLVDYVFNRPTGEIVQECGGVMVTLAALCCAADIDMHASAELELARIKVPETMQKIRDKQASKPKHSPLPEHTNHPVTMRSAEDWTDELFFPDCPVELEEYGSDFVVSWSQSNSHARWQNIEIVRRIQQDAIQSQSQVVRDAALEEAAKEFGGEACDQAGCNIAEQIRSLKSKL